MLSRALPAGALQGKRLGIMRFARGYLPAVDSAFERALDDLRSVSAELVGSLPPDALDEINHHSALSPSWPSTAGLEKPNLPGIIWTFRPCHRALAGHGSPPKADPIQTMLEPSARS